MLILTRRIGEMIYINDDIQVRVLGINGRQVRVGISAPSNISVHREEIWLRIQNGEKQSRKGEQILDTKEQP